MAKDKIVALSDQLEGTMEKIEELKAQLKPLQEEEDAIREKIVSGLMSKGLQYIKTSSGLAFGLVKGRVTYKIAEGRESDALAWAIQEFPGVLTIASAKLAKVVQPMMQAPNFIERHEGEPHLAVRTQEV